MPAKPAGPSFWTREVDYKAHLETPVHTHQSNIKGTQSQVDMTSPEASPPSGVPQDRSPAIAPVKPTKIPTNAPPASMRGDSQTNAIVIAEDSQQAILSATVNSQVSSLEGCTFAQAQTYRHGKRIEREVSATS